MTDQQQAPLQAAPDPAPATRTRNPVYAVLRKVEVDAEVPDHTYVLLTEQISAPSRKDAVRSATEKLEQNMKGGVFLVIPTDSIKEITRTTRQEVVDDWS